MIDKDNKKVEIHFDGNLSIVPLFHSLFTDFLYLVLSANRVWLGKTSTAGF